MKIESKTIKINNTDLPVKEYKGQRVVTLKEIDAIHERPDGTARKRFNDNKKHLIEGEDFFRVCASEIRTHKIMELSAKAHEDIVFLTESGYLMLVKSFTDDLAWIVQRQLVNIYFRSTLQQRQDAANQTLLEIPKDYPSALRALADTFEEKLALEAKIETDAPLVAFAEAASQSNDTISIGDFAKALYERGYREIGQNRLFKRMRDEKILDKRNMPYQKYMDAGLFEVVEICNRNTKRMHRQTRLTGKGQQKLYEQLFHRKIEADLKTDA